MTATRQITNRVIIPSLLWEKDSEKAKTWVRDQCLHKITEMRTILVGNIDFTQIVDAEIGHKVIYAQYSVVPKTQLSLV
jgi:hypothetical protein